MTNICFANAGYFLMLGVTCITIRQLSVEFLILVLDIDFLLSSSSNWLKHEDIRKPF